MTPSFDPDARLMIAYQHGDEDAFTRLFEKYRVPVFRMACHFLSNKDTAEDIAQEVFVRVYQARSKYRPQAKFSTWLYRITINACTTALRKKNHISLSALEDVQSTLRTPEEQMEVDELTLRVKAALSSLPENQRIAVILQRYEDLSYQEIADVMKISRSSVESLLFRAKQTLKAKLADYVEPSSILIP